MLTSRSVALDAPVNYGEQLAKVVNKMLLISETAKLGHTFERGVTKSEIGSRDRETLMTLIHGSTQSGDISATGFESSGTSNSKQKVIDEERIDLLNLSQKNKVMRMLEDWEEPETASQKPVSRNGLTEHSLLFVWHLPPDSQPRPSHIVLSQSRMTHR